MPYELTTAADLLAVQAGIVLGGAKSIVATNAQMRLLRSQIARVLNGESGMKLGIMGDSTEMGRGNGTGTNGEIGARVKSPPSVLARLLQSMGIPARSDFFGGKVNSGLAGTAGYTQYNPDVVFAGASWASTGGLGLPGGYWNNASGTDSMTFTPQKLSDRLDVYYLGSSGTYGTFTVTDSSGTLATVNAGAQASLGIWKAAVTRAVASVLPYNIQRTAGGAVGIFACDPWNSTLPEVRILNAARDGAVSSEFIDQSFAPSARYMIAALQLDYMIAELGLNDKNTAVAMSTYLANILTLKSNHAAVSGAGTFAVATSMPATAASGFDMSTWLSSIRAQAIANDYPLVDIAAMGISREVNPSDYYDTVHLLARGSAMKGKMLADFVAG